MVSSPSPSPSPSSALPSPLLSSTGTEQKPPAAAPPTNATAAEKSDNTKYTHVPTPLHQRSAKKTPRRASSNGAEPAYVAAVSCSDCRFKQRLLAPPSPGAVIRSLFDSLTRRSTPRSSPSATSAVSGEGGGGDGEHWRLAAADLSRRLAAATRARDEALQETTRLKHSLSELELKLARLEAHVLPSPTAAAFPVEDFLRAVASARGAVQQLARALSSHLRNPTSPSPNLESFLNRVFYANFELDTDADVVQSPDPAGRCEANLAAYHAVSALTWEEVLLKGTRHYSEGLSRFCDAKMSEVVASLGWARARAWPEPLLQAFFLAAKGVWGVRLLARSVHPPLPVVRVDRGARFDGRFMEDAAAAGRAAARLEPVSVKMMVAPGFHVYVAGAGVVKCKVLCFYNNANGRSGGRRVVGSSVGSVGKGSSNCGDVNGSVTDVVEEYKTRVVR